MSFKARIYQWMVYFWEEPFFRGEWERAKIKKHPGRGKEKNKVE